MIVIFPRKVTLSKDKLMEGGILTITEKALMEVKFQKSLSAFIINLRDVSEFTVGYNNSPTFYQVGVTQGIMRRRRSFCCRGGVSSSASLGSTSTKDAATLFGLSRWRKNLEHTPTTDSSSCQTLFEFYEECLSGSPASTCEHYQEQMASCPKVYKDAGRRTRVQEIEEWEKDLNRKAIKEGFSGWEEHMTHKHETDEKLCRIAYRLYNECLGENGTYCDTFRNKCPQFEQASKCNAAVDSTS